MVVLILRVRQSVKNGLNGGIENILVFGWRKKTYVACKNESENVIYIKGINALGKKLLEVSNNKLISKWLKKTLSQLGVEYE